MHVYCILYLYCLVMLSLEEIKGIDWPGNVPDLNNIGGLEYHEGVDIA